MNLIEKYINTNKKLNRKVELNEFIQYLDQNEIISLLEIIFLNDEELLIKLFHPVKNIDIDEIAFSSLSKLPYFLLSNLADKLDTIFQRAVEGMYNEKSNIVMKKIISFSEIDIGLTNIFLNNKIYDDKIPTEIKISILFLLFDRGRNQEIDKFLEDGGFAKDPTILPFIIKTKCYKDEDLLLKYIIKIKDLNPPRPNDETIVWFKEIFYDLIFSEMHNYNIFLLGEIFSFVETLCWLNDIISDFLQYEEFKELPKLLKDFTVFDSIFLGPRIDENIKKTYSGSINKLVSEEIVVERYIKNIIMTMPQDPVEIREIIKVRLKY